MIPRGKVAFTQWATAEKAREDAREGPTSVKITMKKTMEDTQDNLVELFHTVRKTHIQHKSTVLVLQRVKEEPVKRGGSDPL